jgi:hypothetical protein
MSIDNITGRSLKTCAAKIVGGSPRAISKVNHVNLHLINNE